MTAFEVVFGLVTMITSLALAHLLSGFVIVVRNAVRVRFSTLHGLWAWIAFTLLIGNWAACWEMNAVESWPSWAVLLIVVNFTIQFAFCALVTPEMPPEEELDLEDFHSRAHRLYVLALIALLVASLVLNLAFGGVNFYASWWRDTVLTVASLLLSVVALFVRARPVHMGATVLIAAMATYFMVVACNVVAVQ